MDKLGYVYVLWAKDTNYIKLGSTKNEVQKRQKQLQTGCPFKLVIGRTYLLEDYKAVEDNLKLVLKDFSKHVEGGTEYIYAFDVQQMFCVIDKLVSQGIIPQTQGYDWSSDSNDEYL